MSDQDRKKPDEFSGPDGRPEVRDSDPMLTLLRGALEEPPRAPRSLLPKIQDRIRLRTRGRYFKDRYSRAVDPVPLLLIMALLLLMIAAAVFLVVQPLVDPPEPIQLKDPPTDPLDPRANPKSERP